MRILHLCTNFWPTTGGIESFVLELARRSRKLGIDASVLCFNRPDRSKPKLPALDEVQGIPILRVPFIDLKYYKPSILPMRQLKAADVLHVHGVGAMLDFAAASKFFHRRPIVLSTHGGIFHTSKLSALKAAYFFAVQRQVLRLVDVVAASSHSDLTLFKHITSKLVLMENGVDIERFDRCEAAAKVPDSYVFVGRLTANKRLDDLLRVFAALHEKEVPFNLRIVGPDWQNIAQRLAATAEAYGIGQSLQLVGAVGEEQLIEELCRAQFFVSASEYEGFGIALIEAMAAGCVPVVNNIGAFRDLLVPGSNGFLADFTAPAAAVGRIMRARDADLCAIAASARARAQAFDWRRKVRDWEELYEGALR